MKMINLLLITITICLIINVKSDSVCELRALKMELKQDLDDNGILDCLRIINPPHFVEESEEQKNLRLAAQWDSSCSFESNTNWFELLKRYYDVSTLVDSIGEPVKEDFEDQADLCEIIRSAVAKNLFNIPDLNMQKLPDDLIDQIDCVGTDDVKKDGPRICAVNGGSFFQKDSWTILMDSAAIKIGGKPEFVPSDNQLTNKNNPYGDSSNPQKQNNLIKDLMKFSKEQLDTKEGELVYMIDKAQDVKKPKNDDQESNSESSTDVHVHVKRLKEVTLKSTEGKFALVDDGIHSFKLDSTRIVFGFYMASFKFEKPGDAFFKINFATREIPESRQAVSQVSVSTVTGGFGEVFNPKNDDKIEIKILYQTSTTGVVNTETGDQNFSFGIISLPEGHSFKKINTSTLEFSKSEKWNSLSNFNLNINFTGKNEKYFLIMYNLSIPLQGAFTLQTRMKLGKSIIPESTVNCGPRAIAGIHSAVVAKIQPENSVVSIEYKYDGDSILRLQDNTDPHYVQSISAFQLPDSTKVKNFKIEKPVTLNSNGEWKAFNFDARITLNKKQTLLILYNINLKVDKAEFAARLRVDSKFNKKSVYITKDQIFANAQGYVVKVMKPGKYNIDLDFKSNSKNAFLPENSELDGQNVSMQIIILN